MNYEIMIKRRLGFLDECVKRNIITSNGSLKGGNSSVGVFYTMVVDYTIFDFLFVNEFREISANDAYEIRNIITNLIETKYKDKILSSYGS
jgi:hypothetical protein